MSDERQPPVTPWDATLPSHDAPTQVSRQPAWPVPPAAPRPTYPAPVLQPQRKHSAGRSRAIVGAVFAGVLVACCLGMLAAAGLASSTLAAIGRAAQATQTAHARVGPSHVGGAITVGGVTCSLTSARVLPAGAFITPKSGNEYVLVHVKLVNTGTGEAHYSPLEFHIKSGAGVITGPDFIYPTTYTAHDQLDTGILAAGAATEGDILFQAPAGDHTLLLTWQPNPFASATENAWALGL